MIDDEDDWLDDALLVDDEALNRNWRSKARGMTLHDAAAAQPTYGQFNCRVPIAQWRVAKEHMDALEISQGAFMRQAIGARLVAEGVDPVDIEAFLRAPGASR